MPANSSEAAEEIGTAVVQSSRAEPRIAVAKPIRIEPAFEDRASVRELFRQHGPYGALAAHLPDGYDEAADPRPVDAVYPWFRGTWALGGRSLVRGAECILHNAHFLAAARELFPAARIVPKLVVVNVNAPMPAGVAHVDVPVFRGANRENFAPRLLMAMGASGLFEPWRVIQVGAIAWFYDGLGGNFEYWPDGPEGPIQSERAPFGNVAVVADGDRMYHRIGRIGPPNAVLPRMTESAEMRLDPDGAWSIVEKNECRARYPQEAVRLSIVWKAEVSLEDSNDMQPDRLGPQRIFQTLSHDLHQRGVLCANEVTLLQDREWIDRVCRLYMGSAKPSGPSSP